MNILPKVLLGIYIIVLGFLLYSVILSGLFYQYDNDEISHIQTVYLLAKGFEPNIDFSMTFTPLYHWVLMPLFSIGGFSFATIFQVRVLMVTFFVLRIVLSMVIVRWLVHWRGVLYFLPLFLLDPFTSFNGMQIRPDNLMVLVWTIGIVCFVYAMQHSSKRSMIASGFSIALSLIILLKVLPMTIFFVGGFGAYCLLTKKYEYFIWFCLGGIGAVVGFLVVYAAIYHSLQPLVQGIVIDRAAMNGSIVNPAHIWFYYKPNNTLFFGFPGKPLTWRYIFILPTLALGGVIVVLKRCNQKLSMLDVRIICLGLLAICLLGEWFWLCTVNGAFSQYFLPINWLWGVFGAVALVAVTEVFKSRKIGLAIVNIALLILFIMFTSVLYQSNINRSHITSDEFINYYTHVWSVVPENERTFPNILFRPVSYPLALGSFIGDMPQILLKRLGPVSAYLEKYNVRYVLMDDYMAMFVDPPSRTYIKQHYEVITEPIKGYRRVN